jgi:hypothetical protein
LAPSDRRESFSASRQPADGVWKDGHSIAAADYDMDDVRQMGRKLWAKHVIERKRRLVT